MMLREILSGVTQSEPAPDRRRGIAIRVPLPSNLVNMRPGEWEDVSVTSWGPLDPILRLSSHLSAFLGVSRDHVPNGHARDGKEAGRGPGKGTEC